MISRRAWIATPLALLLLSCSEAPKEAKKKEPEKPAEPIDGQKAFFQMFISARTWAPDAQGLELISIEIDGVKSKDGKYGAWQGTFTSQSKGKLKPITYSVIEAGGNLHKGVFAGHEESFSGKRGQQKPWLVAAFKKDSADVWETVQKKDAAFIQKNPTLPVNFRLESTPRYPNLYWRVLFGDSVSSSVHSVFIDASTGDFLGEGK